MSINLALLCGARTIQTDREQADKRPFGFLIVTRRALFRRNARVQGLDPCMVRVVGSCMWLLMRCGFAPRPNRKPVVGWAVLAALKVRAKPVMGLHVVGECLGQLCNSSHASGA